MTPAGACARTPAQFGRYRTRKLIIAYLRALAAGDIETRVAA